VYVIQSSCEQQLAAATYFAFVADGATCENLEKGFCLILVAGILIFKNHENPLI
jgi:hypothetical protein